jgi:hypothetical protein
MGNVPHCLLIQEPRHYQHGLEAASVAAGPITSHNKTQLSKAETPVQVWSHVKAQLELCGPVCMLGG